MNIQLIAEIMGTVAFAISGAMIVVVIRLLASHYKWNIPRVM